MIVQEVREIICKTGEIFFEGARLSIVSHGFRLSGVAIRERG